MKSGSCLLPAAVLLCILPINQSMAQTTATLPDCSSVDSDSDGDGFGWENNQSCMVVDGQAMQAQIGQCVDTDGDGFGWNGFETCDPIDHADQTTVTLASCVYANSDVDGDGFGWEDNRSCIVAGVGGQSQVPECIDTDGDGFGWNGVETCDPSDLAVVSHTVTFVSIDGFPARSPIQTRPYPVTLEDFSDVSWTCLDYRTNGNPVPFSGTTWIFNADGTGNRERGFSMESDLFTWNWTDEGAVITMFGSNNEPFFFFVNNLPGSSYLVRGNSPESTTVNLVTRSGLFEGGLGCSEPFSLSS